MYLVHIALQWSCWALGRVRGVRKGWEGGAAAIMKHLRAWGKYEIGTALVSLSVRVRMCVCVRMCVLLRGANMFLGLLLMSCGVVHIASAIECVGATNLFRPR